MSAKQAVRAGAGAVAAAAGKGAAAGGGAGGGAAAGAGQIKGKAKLLIPSGEAKPGPSIGQSLGPLGVNMAEFCKQFNAESVKTVKPGIPVPVRLTAFKDRTFNFKLQTPPTSWFLKQCAGIDKGGAKPGLEPVGTVSLKQLYEVALIKQRDMPHVELRKVVRQVFGSTRSLGLTVVEGRAVASGAAAAAGAAPPAGAAAAAAPAGGAGAGGKAAGGAGGKPAAPPKAAPPSKPAAASAAAR